MSEEVKIKISQPMFEVGELEAFDSNIHNIVEEYSKMMFKEKNEILTQRLIMKQNEEIERLNNIINAIEKALKDNIEELEEHQLSRDRIDEDKNILRFIQELKGSDKE